MGGNRGRLIPTKDRAQAVALVHEAQASGARKREACEELGVSLRTLERWEKPEGTKDKRDCANRPSQPNQLTEEERQMILTTINSEKYRDLPPSKIVPLLADEGCYIGSEATFYRVLRSEKQLTHRQRSKPPTHSKPRACIATSPNKVWTWDISYLPTFVEGLYLYLILDIYSRKIVGWSIHERELSELAAGLVEQACMDERVGRDQLVLHADNGAPMKAAMLLCTLEKLGVTSSFSRPSVSDDNPYSESLFRTVKYHPTFPIQSRFETIFDARVWMEKFVVWYNTEHLHSGVKFVTPHQRHTGEAEIILQKRHDVYQLAKQRHPERWTGKTRNWILPDAVTLNPDKKGRMQQHDTQNRILVAV